MVISKKKLQNYRTKNPCEHNTICAAEKYLELLESKTTILPNHITGSAWVIDPKNMKVLLTLHKQLNKWIQLGGHMNKEDNNNVYNTAIREAIEESGIQDLQKTTDEIFHLDVHYIPKIKNQEAHFRYDFNFIFKIKENNNFSISPESKDLKWFSLAELANMELDLTVKNMFKKWQILSLA